MKTIELNVEKRSTTGKGEARRVRAAGRIPGVVYGANKPNVPISLDRKALADLFREGRARRPSLKWRVRPEPPREIRSSSGIRLAQALHVDSCGS